MGVARRRAAPRRRLPAIRLTLAQPAISSRLVDHLNASYPVRTMFTDVFLVDEILKKRLPKKV